MKKNIQNDFDWVIHCIKNGSKCAVCGEPINDMMPGSANYHTHGMKKYKHPDFQLVLNYDMQVAGYILNTLADRVRSGERFKDGAEETHHVRLFLVVCGTVAKHLKG